MDHFLNGAIIKAGDHMGSVVRMMVGGVAFRTSGTTYRVFSHEGDELGTIATSDLCFAISYMKRLGRAVGKCHNPVPLKTYSVRDPAYTFAWQGWHTWA